MFRYLLIVSAFLMVTSDLAPYYVNYRSIDGMFIIGVEHDVEPKEMKKRLLIELGGTTISIVGLLESAPKVVFANFDPKYVDQVRSIPGVSYVEADGPVVMQAAKKSKEPEVPEWNLDRINQRDIPLDGNSDYAGNGGEGTHIYLIDTGISRGHLSFEGKEKLSFDTQGTKGNDCNGHGTHAGAIIVTKRWGIAPNATIHSVKVHGCRGHSTISQICRGINYITRKRRLPCVVQVGSITEEGISPSIDEGVKAISKLDCVVVVPAGNDANDSCFFSPSRLDEVITVGALGHWDYIHPYSNWGKCVDIFAPGQKIRSAWYISKYDNDTLSGTSMAASHVSGGVCVFNYDSIQTIWAALLQLSSGTKPDQIKSKLIKQSTKNRMHGVMNGSPSRILYIKPPQANQKKKPKPRTEL